MNFQINKGGGIIDDTSFVIDTMDWSFSRLNSFYNCRYEWYLHYILANPSEGGFFSEYGSLMHSVLEKYVKGELSIFELNQYFEDHFNEFVPHDAPPNSYVDLRQSYFDKGIDYLDNIDLDLEKYEILGVEKKIEFELFNKHFVGFIDLLLRDKNTDEIIILDHKSASLKILKNGSVSKSDQNHFLEFKRQLYLYSLPVIKEYGKVDKLKWNLFKEQKSIEIPWERNEYDETLKWVEDTIQKIEQEKEWAPDTSSEYYCRYLCGQRNNACEYKQ